MYPNRHPVSGYWQKSARWWASPPFTKIRSLFVYVHTQAFARLSAHRFLASSQSKRDSSPGTIARAKVCSIFRRLVRSLLCSAMLSYAKEHRLTSLCLNRPGSREANKRMALDRSRMHDTIGLACNVRVDGLGSAHSFARVAVSSQFLTQRPPCQGISVERQANKGR